jgi:hypothetical protein
VLGASFVLSVLGGCSSRDDSARPPVDSDTTTPPTMGTVTKNGISVWLDSTVKSMVWVQWNQPADSMAHVEYSFDDDVWLSSPTEPAPSGPNQRILVGIPFDASVDIRLVTDDAGTVDGPGALTGPNPRFADYDLPKAELVSADEARWYAAGKYLLTSINDHSGGWRDGTYYTIVLDRQGRTVWAKAAPDEHWTLYATIDPIARDHFLWDESTKWSSLDDGAGSLIHRAYLDREIETIPAVGLHHEWVELPDGTLAWGSVSPEHSTNSEALVELAPGASEPTPIWICSEDWPGAAHCESNGLFYEPSTGRYLYSFYTNNSLVEVDRASGETVWWAGAVEGGSDFVPNDSQFAWQHGVSYTANGTLLLSTKSALGGSGITTYVREYEVDRENDTLHQRWYCDSEVYAVTNGDTWRLANDNTLHVLGSAGHIKEYAPDCSVVWHLDFGNDYLLGRGEFVDDLYSLVSPVGKGMAP